MLVEKFQCFSLVVPFWYNSQQIEKEKVAREVSVLGLFFFFFLSFLVSDCNIYSLVGFIDKLSLNFSGSSTLTAESRGSK